MSAMNVSSGGGDSLTRTTLRVDGTTSAALLASVVHAMQRVPGVLLADLDAATARLVVAHDGAVPVTALVNAATQAGVSAHVMRTGGAAAPGAPIASPPPAMSFNGRGRIMLVAMSLLVGAIVLIDIAVPNVTQKRALFDGGIVAVWIFFFASTYLRRR